MTLHAVTVPNWGLAMEEGTLTAWLVGEGDVVEAGDEIAEIETSKIANVLEAAMAGTLVRRVAREGDVMPVGALLGVIADTGEDSAAVDAFVAGYAERVDAVPLVAPPAPVTAEIDGQSFRYLRLAPPDELGSARPVVLIHGFGGDHRGWIFNQAPLAEDRPVYAIDLPGHGGSTKQVGDGSLEMLAERVAAWMEQMGRGRVHIVGHSMGAAVAGALALHHSDCVKSVTAISGVGFGGTLNRDYVDGFLAATRVKELKPVVELLFADPALVRREMLEDLIAAKRIDGAADALRAIADGALDAAMLAGLPGQIERLTVPVLRISGSLDRVVVDGGRDGALAVTAGHMPHLEAPTMVNAAIRAFILEND